MIFLSYADKRYSYKYIHFFQFRGEKLPNLIKIGKQPHVLELLIKSAFSQISGEGGI